MGKKHLEAGSLGGALDCESSVVLFHYLGGDRES